MIGPTHCPRSDSSRISGLCLEKTFTGIIWTGGSEALLTSFALAGSHRLVGTSTV